MVDVREQSEWDEGFIPGAVHVPRGFLESRIAGVAKADRRIVVSCAVGARSLLAAQTLREMGYTDVSSLAGGFTDWKRGGHSFDVPRRLSDAQRRRYSRHILIPEVGEAGQLKLLGSKVLLIGAGGLGSPAALYLAAAGVGTLGLVDDDVVDESNLQRQIIHTTDRVGVPRASRPRNGDPGADPDTIVNVHPFRVTKDNVLDLIAQYDVIVDGADNFPTRYLLNDAALMAQDPARPREHPAVRGTRVGVHAVRGAVLSMPVPGTAAAGARAVMWRGRSARRAVRRHGEYPGERGDQGAARDRRHARRTSARLRRPRE